MKKIRIVALGVAIVLCLVAGFAVAGEAEKAAVKSAESWLALVDAGNYGKSWQESAELFRTAVTKETWDQSLKAARAPLGDMLSRKVKSSQYATSLPGAPDGEYVVIQFETTFSKKKAAIETVTPMKGPDGKWRVSGYFIK